MQVHRPHYVQSLSVLKLSSYTVLKCKIKSMLSSAHHPLFLDLFPAFPAYLQAHHVQRVAVELLKSSATIYLEQAFNLTCHVDPR